VCKVLSREWNVEGAVVGGGLNVVCDYLDRVCEIVGEDWNFEDDNNVNRACKVVDEDWNIECDNLDRVCEVV
ncbi:40664_t:CDS:1, partial [Gigaspora margarita]